ncbi:cobaltochelatase subunit CobN [Euhalothece natronophila Z-M001]|uniref:Cobaltochelatase subunit CobN n=1 Tax=Euhalothece natronophila Z-M001 TaxID=522448 RepID=A0A5B8NM05_9CHRO|nr:cobaltochelatase subunit CobN [Euhalothece natronophila]QDZ40074.1 cobaltochelatase subunit CobN [Euhalothece natronophila Z-M001]
MHRIAATPGGWTPDSEGVVFIEQTPASIVVLTAADTDIQMLATAVSQLPSEFPEVRVANILNLQQELSIDTYADTVLSHAKVIILRLLGGRAYWSYGLEVVRETAEENGAFLLVLPGDDRADPTLTSHSTVSLSAVNQLWQYFNEGGVENCSHALQYIADLGCGTNYQPPAVTSVPRVGIYSPTFLPKKEDCWGTVGILFYRAHYLAGNTSPIDLLCEELSERGLFPVPIFVSALSQEDIQAEVFEYCQDIEIILNTTSFSLAKFGEDQQTSFWQKLNVPVLQVILSGGTKEQWESGMQGLTPRDVAMNVALPEVDGRVITRAISFKSSQQWNEQLETDVVTYEPVRDRAKFVVNLASNWLQLLKTPNAEKKVALILANYPNKDGRLANGVGLDTPESCLQILQALKAAGYQVSSLPENGDELIQWLTAGVTNDPEGQSYREVRQTLSRDSYQEYFATLPEQTQQEITQRWGENIPSSAPLSKGGWGDRYGMKTDTFAISGIQFGNIFVGIQPSRGYDFDPSLNYHSPDLEPTPEYLAFYHWLRQNFQTQAIIHVGKHGNLEWLPGKSISLSQTCYPEIALASIPHFYPFIVNDPGEGSQAKRRAHAVILDHLTPPLTRAELYGKLQQLEGLIDEYYEAQTLDPSRLPIIADKISELVTSENLHQDLGIEEFDQSKISEFLTLADGYLCELKESQIRDGLHIFGQCPQGRQLRDLILSIARSPGKDHIGISRAIAQSYHFDFDPLTSDYSQPVSFPNTSLPEKLREQLKNAYIIGDAIEAIETYAAELITTHILENQPFPSLPPLLEKELIWIQSDLFPKLKATPEEITHLLQGLDGNYIPPGAAGAPTRGRPDVLPTGRNFYSVDIRGIPTETAWDVGRKAAETLIERYTQDNGEYPQSLAISVWGTSTMRTGGDDIAQAFALMGVKPIWDGVSRRVVDFEILPLSMLQRPRVDVTLRISGFFRDGFPNLLDLFNQVVEAVSNLEESAEENPLANQAKQEAIYWQEQGLSVEEAKARSRYRIFGSKPGAYGAGLQGLIESQNWQTDEDLAQAYINWSSYAYTEKGEGKVAPEAFKKRLQNLQVVLHNQDNREHDLLDSDDYYQFQGGLTAAVRSMTGKNPQTYFGDNSVIENPKVRQLSEEITRVYRSRVVNPKWLEGVMRHGYKGAFEISATVDYLFAYDATAQCVENYMYEGVANAYLLDETVKQFLEAKNPWAMRDIAERLLEAHQRGMWNGAPSEMLEQLRGIVHEAEGVLEEKM